MADFESVATKAAVIFMAALAGASVVWAVGGGLKTIVPFDKPGITVTLKP